MTSNFVRMGQGCWQRLMRRKAISSRSAAFTDTSDGSPGTGVKCRFSTTAGTFATSSRA